MDDAQPVAVVETKPRRRWLRRAILWGLVGLVVLVVVVAGVIGIRIAQVKGSEPYRMTLEKVSADARVLKRLGEPLADALVPAMNQIDIRDGQGEALLRFSISGPSGSADVSSALRMIDNVWGLTRVEVTFEDDERIVLDTSEASGGPEDAPLWQP